MEWNIVYIILALIGTFLTLFWLYLYIKGKNKYNAYIDALNNKEYFMKDIYFIGYELINFFKVEFRDKYSRSREKKMSEIKGKKLRNFILLQI